MRLAALLLVSLLHGPAWGQPAPCTAQNYTDPKKEPRWDCPGPDEDILVPQIQARPSIGLESGSSFTKKGTNKSELIEYPAVLMDKDKVIELGLRVKGLRRLLWLEHFQAAKVLDIERKYLSDRLQAQLELEKSRVTTLASQRDEARKERDRARSWYRSWTFGLVVGVVATSAAAVSAAYIAK